MPVAETVAIELEARNSRFDASIRQSRQLFEGSMSAVERSANDAERAIARSSSSIVASQGNVAASTRNLGFQISDVGQQLSGGQSPFVIFGQQAPQFVQAFQDISAAGAGVGTVLRSIALPGILAVVSILGTLIEKTLGAADAEGVHKAAADDLQQAVDRLAGASARSNHQTELGIGIDIRAAEAKRQLAIRTRQQLQAELEAARGRLATADRQTTTDSEGGINFGVAGGATQEREIGRINALLVENANKIKESDKAIASGRAQLVLRGITAATDKAAGATQRYENTIDRLRRKFERGGFGDPNSTGAQAEFQRLGEAATRQRDATLDAVRATDRASGASRGHAVSLRIQNTAAREAAAAQRELETALTSLVQKYDPAAAAAANYAEELRKIAALEAGGKITPGQAEQFREGAGSTFRKTRADTFTLESVENFRPGAEQDEKDAAEAAKAQQQAAADAERDTQQRREQNIRSLANLYEDLFTRSSGSVWDNFKRDGFRAIAILLAKATVSSFSAGGGGFGSLLSNIGKAVGGSIGGGTPGFASGGALLIGGNGGTDRNLLSLNGAPIARVSKGEVVNVSPNVRATQRGGGGTTVMQTIQVDARGAVMNDAFARDILARAGQDARQVVSANNGTIRKGLPAAQARYDALGTT